MLDHCKLIDIRALKALDTTKSVRQHLKFEGEGSLLIAVRVTSALLSSYSNGPRVSQVSDSRTLWKHFGEMSEIGPEDQCLHEEPAGYETQPAKFPLGRLVATPNALRSLAESDIRTALARHGGGDWGELDEPDRAENELSLRESFRLVSVYQAADGTKFWIITEADRSATTVLLPEDY